LYDGRPTLAMSGDGRPHANGHYFKTVDVTPGTYYRFSTHFKTVNIEEVERCVLARIVWLNKDLKRTGFIEYPALTKDLKENEWNQISQVYLIPDEAVKARIELVYRWDADGTTYYGGTTLMKTEKPDPRLVKLASVHYRPRNTSSPQENLEKFAMHLHKAGEKRADIVCLPEGITMAGTGKTYLEVSEPVPGPSTDFLGEIAKKHEMYIVAGIYEREGPVVYNTSVLIGRDGKFIGKYRKVSLPREEIEGGITPGNSFPVFDTDFGRIGMMICWDVTFPEPAKNLASKGAEVIFMPIWGGNINLAKARAIENQIYLVSSAYDMKTGVFDLEGELIVEGTDKDPVAIVEIDLNEQKLWPWLGEYKNRIARERPPKNIVK